MSKPSNGLRMLVACEYSGRVRDAFAAKGWDAWSCDLRPTESPGNHVEGDVLPLLREPWDLVIAHPPCPRLCQTGWSQIVKWKLHDEIAPAAEFFLACLNANAPRVCVENPVMHAVGKKLVGRTFDFSIQPYEFGDPYTKRTCFWTRGLPRLNIPLTPAERREAAARCVGACAHNHGSQRAKQVAKTYKGVATAMADQWSKPFALGYCKREGRRLAPPASLLSL